MLAELIKKTDLIVWDEAPMQDRFGPEAVDHTLQDIRNNSRPFGGITTVFGGDFRQILPVKINGSRETTVASCLLKSFLWRNIKVLHLTQNMRLSTDPDDAAYANWLLEVGNGKHTADDDSILLSDDKKCGDTVESLIHCIYPSIRSMNPSISDRHQDK